MRLLTCDLRPARSNALCLFIELRQVRSNALCLFIELRQVRSNAPRLFIGVRFASVRPTATFTLHSICDCIRYHVTSSFFVPAIGRYPLQIDHDGRGPYLCSPNFHPSRYVAVPCDLNVTATFSLRICVSQAASLQLMGTVGDSKHNDKVQLHERIQFTTTR